MGEAPSGVRLHFADGKTVECAVTRAPELDRQHRKGVIEYYVARPVTDVSPDLTYRVTIDRRPPMTGVHLDIGQDVTGGLFRGMDRPKI